MIITYELGDKLYVNITNQCQNACDFCIRNHADGINESEPLWLEREPTTGEIISDILTRDLSKYTEVVFCGFGEPTMRLDVLLETAKKIRAISNVLIRINTNGLSDISNGFTTSEKMAGLIDIISISLNASTPEKYDDVCHSQFGLKALPAILEFTKSAVRFVPTVMMTVVDTIGEEEIENCRKLCAETGAEFKVRAFID